MVPVAMGEEGVTAVIVKDAHARPVTSIAEEIHKGAEIDDLHDFTFIDLTHFRFRGN